MFFKEPLYESQTTWILGSVIYGGADIGECVTTARRIKDGDAESWYREWTATAERVLASAEQSAAGGHYVSAREAYLRASSYFRASYIFLFGSPVDPCLVAAFEEEVAAFLKAAALFTPAIEPVEIPFEGTTLPGYFYRVDDSGEPRPTLICTNGYDSTIQQMHFGFAVAALRRGYNCLLFDGPGQGRVLIKQGLHMRPDWENVVTPVVDYALSLPEVDGERLALSGWSFGGYLAPRAAAGEPRIKALIADPGLWDLAALFEGPLRAVPGVILEDLLAADEHALDLVMKKVMANPTLHWTLVQRGFWVHGVDTLSAYFKLARNYALRERAKAITCPTFVTWGENDRLSAHAETLFDALTCPKTLVRFYEREGGGDHCEGVARSLFHQRAFDWLDSVFSVKGRAMGSVGY